MLSPKAGALLLLPALAAALIFFTLSRTAASGKSAVYDEPVHLLSGYRILTAADRDFNHEHPPLMKALAALPVVLEGAARPVVPWTYAHESDEWPLSHAWLYHVNDGDRLLSLARLPIAIAGACLAFMVALVASTIAGDGGKGIGEATRSAMAMACAAGGLCATEPNLLAHGSLVTTDMGMTIFFFAAVAAFERCLGARETAARAWGVAAGVLWGLGLLTKFTSVLLAPAFLAMGAASILLDRRTGSIPAAAEPPARRGKGRGRIQREAPGGDPAGAGAWRRLLVSFGVATGVALLTLNAGYGFHGSFTSLGKMNLESASLRLDAKGAIGAIPLPAPPSWIAGYDHAEAGGQRWWSYLMGMHSMTGWRGYYLIALLVKTSIPLLLFATSGATLLSAVPGVNRRRLLLLSIPPAMLLVAFNLSGNLKNIGLRYVLPVYPFLCLLGGLGVVALWRSWKRFGKIAAVVLLVWVASAEAKIYPDHLAYFNEIAGGPDGGRWWLLDSNLDWGQDLKGLGAWMKTSGVEEIYLDYFGRACPRYYGIRTTRDFEGGYLAVSATNLEGVYREDRDRYDFLAGVRPVTTIGHSILLFNVPRPPGWKTPGAAPLE
jgi:hypothetical protein